MTLNISIIIPTLDEEEHLGELLAALKDYSGLEIIVADGGSRDTTLEIARRFPVRIIEAPPGRASQQNKGAREASKPTLLFLHSDTQLPADFPGQIEKVLQRPDTAAGAFRLGIDGQGIRFRLVEWGANIRSRLLGLPYGDQALFMSRETFARIGGFPDLPFLEDLELVRAIKRIGEIRIAAGQVTTSARRWKRLGVMRTLLLNQCILLGYYCGMDAAKLRRFYYGASR